MHFKSTSKFFKHSLDTYNAFKLNYIVFKGKSHEHFRYLRIEELIVSNPGRFNLINQQLNVLTLIN